MALRIQICSHFGIRKDVNKLLQVYKLVHLNSFLRPTLTTIKTDAADTEHRGKR